MEMMEGKALEDWYYAIRTIERIRMKASQAVDTIRASGAPGKSYDGDIIVSAELFKDGEERYRITLLSYLLCPGRDYVWTGRNLLQCAEKAEKQIDQWIAEEMNDL